MKWIKLNVLISRFQKPEVQDINIALATRMYSSIKDTDKTIIKFDINNSILVCETIDEIMEKIRNITKEDIPNAETQMAMDESRNMMTNKSKVPEATCG